MIHLVTPHSHKHFFNTLWSCLPGPKYATAGEVDVSEFPMPTSILVDGVNLALPLSHNDFSNLRKTACAQTSGVRHAWEVDASKVSCPQMPEFFSKVVPDLAVHAVRAMGLDDRALGVEVRLHKLFLYEQDGQLDLYKDVEKEDGMFARMIVQLPTEVGHKGGKLELRHGEKSVTVDFSGAKSSTGYFSTVFFSDCEHQPAKLETGSRLCLVFKLMRNNPKFMDVSVVALPHYMSALGRVETFFKRWVGEPALRPLVIPLNQKYSKDNMSFTRLSGHDRIVAGLVLNCASFLDVHLCLLVRKHDGYKRSYHEIKNWIQPDGTKLFNSAVFEVANVKDNIGGPLDPAEKIYEGFVDYKNGPKHSRSVLVLWPKDRMIEVLGSHARRCSMPKVLRCLEEQHKLKPERTSDSFQQYLTVLDGHTDPKAVKNLLEFCLQHDLRDGAFMVIRKWSLDLIENYSHSIISTIWKYGWADCYSGVLWELFEQPNIDAKQNIGNFPKHLLNRGLQDAAVCAARQLLMKTNMQSSFSFQSSLLEFLLESKLEDETLYLLSVLTDSICFGPHLVKVVKQWGGTAFTPIEKFWQRKLEATINTNEHKRSKDFLRAFAEFVCRLHQEGCHDAAVVFGKKNFIDPGDIYNGREEDNIDDTDALVLLLRCEERFHETVRLKIGSQSLAKLVVKMKEVAGVIGLMEDDKVMELFMELLSRAVEIENGKSDLVEVVCWVEKMVQGVPVEGTEYDPSGSAADGLAEPGKLDSLLNNEEVVRDETRLQLDEDFKTLNNIELENNLPVPPRQHPKFRRRRSRRRHPNRAQDCDRSSSPGVAIFTALLLFLFIIFFSFYCF